MRKDQTRIAGTKLPSRETRELLRSIVANSPVIVWALNQRGEFLLSEGKGLAALGMQPGEIVGRSIYDVYRDVPEMLQYARQALQGEMAHGLVHTWGIVFETWHSPLRSSRGEVVGVAGMAFDVTQRQKAKAELLQERSLLENMLNVHERDRKLVAYEIHDGPVQTATAAALRLEAVLSRSDLAEGEARQQIDTALQLVRKTIDDSRRMIRGLRPPELEEQGIVAAIESYMASLPSEGPKVELETSIEHHRWDPVLESTVFRIVQEGLTNIALHSRAARAAVRLSEADGYVRVVVQDWGVGFDPQAIDTNRFGLQGIRERARLMRGSADIESQPGSGTRITVSLPVSIANESE